MLERSLVAVMLLCALHGCTNAPAGLAVAPEGSGPRVLHDWFARPLPEIPLPNDLATRVDPTTGTGLRLNVSLVGDTRLEREVRANINQLDGFGTFAPITVSFDAPLDIGALLARHGTNRDASDDAVYVVNIDPESPEFGERVPLDLGRGFFPATLPQGTTYFPGDARQDSVSLIFETFDEDTNGNGALDPGEDTDQDGVLDEPNVHPRGALPADGLMTFYERETNTLVLHPVVPMREQTEYAVVLTNRLVGEDGEPVRSPFASVNHHAQTPSLRRLHDVFAAWREEGIELDVNQIAFAWTFTTQTVTRDLVAIREGLHGEGPLGWLADEFPADVSPAQATTGAAQASNLTLPGTTLGLISELAFAQIFGLSEVQVSAFVEDLGAVDYAAQGYFDTPDFLTSDAAAFDRTFDLDARAGTARVQPSRIPFLLVVPKATEQFQPPFRVAIYSHGFGQARIEPLAFSAILARYGIATIGIDTWGHGINLPPEAVEQVNSLGFFLGARPFLNTMIEGRAVDVDGNGRVDPGDDMFSSYAFHTRDTMRQSAVDHFQLVRALRGFDGTRTWDYDANGDGANDLAGDFNGDGVVDVGGPDAPYYMWGSSMGGLLTGLVAPLEPAIIAAAPVAGGAAMSHFGRRSRQQSVIANTVMGVIGPVIVGLPDPDSARTHITYHFPQANRLRAVPLGEVALEPGDRVVVTNVTRDEQHEGTVLADGTFAISMRTDRGDVFRVELRSPGGSVIETLSTWPSDFFLRFDEPALYAAGSPLRAPNEGWGYSRGSPDMRRLVGLSQIALEPADPINYARHFFREPLDIRPEGPRTTNLLDLVTVGDPMNPSDVHVAHAVAAGVLDLERDDPRYGMPAADWLIANWVLEGVCGYGRFPPNSDGDEVLFDPDALDRLAGRGDQANGFNSPRPNVGDELRATLSTATGESGMRYGHMLPCGKHSFFLTDPSNPFNIDEYLNSLAGYYFATGGTRILDDGCHELSSCDPP